MFATKRGCCLRAFCKIKHGQHYELTAPAACLPCSAFRYGLLLDTLPSHRRFVKTVTKRRVKELEQGILPTNIPPTAQPDDESRPSTLLQGVRENIETYPECVVLTKVGNFYELYFEHAQEYGPLLGLKVSTRRTSAKNNGPVVYMAGFPFWQLDRFLKILVQDLNKYVAISEEFPLNLWGKVKTGGMMYDRRVARIVTPGTLIDEKFLNPLQNNFLLSIEVGMPTSAQDRVPQSESIIGLAWLDLSTGDFFTEKVERQRLASMLARIGAKEVLLSCKAPADVQREVELIGGHSHELITRHDSEATFSTMLQWNAMLESPVLDADERKFSLEEKLAGHRLLDYIRLRLFDLQLKLQPPQRRDLQDILHIDRSSIKGLEVLETSRDGFGKGSLFHAIRRTVTNSGSRLLRDRLTFPSASITEIHARLDLVEFFCALDELREVVVECLRRTYDIQRLVQKFTLNKGDADDMLCLARGISEAVNVRSLLTDRKSSPADERLAFAGVSHVQHPISTLLSRMPLEKPLRLSDRILDAIDEEGLDEKHRLEEKEAMSAAALAQDAVKDSPPNELEALPKAVQKKVKVQKAIEEEEMFGDVWTMKRGATKALAQLHDDLESLKGEKLNLTRELRTQMSLPSLTLKWSPALRHYGHVKTVNGISKDLLESVNARLIPTSSKSTEIFYISEWSKLGLQIEHAQLAIRQEEQRVFSELREEAIKNLVLLRRVARILDELDVSTAFATLAKQQGWTRPQLNDGTAHKIIGGRHPTVKLGLEEQGRAFVSNDLFLGGQERVWLVTGPNMAGKSTFLRQNALITILAQVGSFVPAEHAEIGIVDQIFSRIGAADDLFRDQSTFMVEMSETASILKHATPRSFVIMDEVGRGTTPIDGTAVSYAALHHLYHQNKCRTLFATHFHKLADMSAGWDHIGQYCTDIEEDASGAFSFIHKLKPGVNRQSHALKIAKLAALPDSALLVAKQIIDELNSHDNSYNG